MATLRCRVAERLLTAYLRALSDSNRTHMEYLRNLRFGRAGFLEKALQKRTRQVRSAHEAVRVHAASHGCLTPVRVPGRVRGKKTRLTNRRGGSAL